MKKEIESLDLFKSRLSVVETESSSPKNLKEELYASKEDNKSLNFLKSVNYPFSCLGIVTGKNSNSIKGCSYVFGNGTLISSNLVLTSAKIVFNKETKKIYSNLLFKIGLINEKFIDISRIIDYYFPNDFATTYQDDIVILVIDRDLGKIYGYMELTLTEPTSTARCFCYGYKVNKNI